MLKLPGETHAPIWPGAIIFPKPPARKPRAIPYPISAMTKIANPLTESIAQRSAPRRRSVGEKLVRARAMNASA